MLWHTIASVAPLHQFSFCETSLHAGPGVQQKVAALRVAAAALWADNRTLRATSNRDPRIAGCVRSEFHVLKRSNL